MARARKRGADRAANTAKVAMIDRILTSWYGPPALRRQSYLSTGALALVALSLSASGVVLSGCGPVEYINQVGIENIAAYEQELLDHATHKISSIPGVRLIGTAKERAGVISFVLDGVHPHDIGTILDQEGIAVRTGHHCAQPIMQRFGIPATARASFALYNTKEEVEALAQGILKVKEVFA